MRVLTAVVKDVIWKDTLYWRTCPANACCTDVGWKHCSRGVCRTRRDEVFCDCLGDDLKMTLAQLDVKPEESKRMMGEVVKKAHVFCGYVVMRRMRPRPWKLQHCHLYSLQQVL